MTVPLRLSQNRQKIAIGVTTAAWLGRGYVLLANFRHTWRLTAWFYSYIFVHGFPGSRLFKMTFPESRFVKIAKSHVPFKITIPNLAPRFSKIPNPGLQKSQIPDPEKPIGDPLYLIWCLKFEQITIPYSVGLLLLPLNGDDMRYEVHVVCLFYCGFASVYLLLMLNCLAVWNHCLFSEVSSTFT